MKRHLEYSDKRGTNLLGSYTPCFLKTSATIGTVELTGLEITSTKALGAVVAIPVARSRTIPALICRGIGGGASVSFHVFSIFHSFRSIAGRKQTNLEEILPTCDVNRSSQLEQRNEWGRGTLPRHLWTAMSTCTIMEYRIRTPGLRGIPAGMTTISAPVRAFLSPSSGGR